MQGAVAAAGTRRPRPPLSLLYFLAQAQVPGGKFRNHLGYDRQWRGQPGTEDGWGCALWALGTAAARGPTAGIREESFIRFSRGTRVSSPSAQAMAFASLGAAEIPDSRPGHSAALALLYRARVAIGDPAADAGWPWSAPRLSYASGAVAEAVIVSGHYLGDGRLLRKGLRMLEWLLAAETRNGHLSVASRQGRSRGEAAPPPASGQRPAEVAALADACVRAATSTPAAATGGASGGMIACCSTGAAWPPRRHALPSAKATRQRAREPELPVTSTSTSPGRAQPRASGPPLPGGQPAEGLGCRAMAEIVLRVRLIGGEHLDVTYEQDAGTPEETVDRVISTLAEDNGLLRCRHGGRLIVLYGRGVATLEVAPRGAVL